MKMFLAGVAFTLTVMAGWAAWSQDVTASLIEFHFAAAVSPSGHAIPIQADEQGRVICSPVAP